MTQFSLTMRTCKRLLVLGKQLVEQGNALLEVPWRRVQLRVRAGVSQASHAEFEQTSSADEPAAALGFFSFLSFLSLGTSATAGAAASLDMAVRVQASEVEGGRVWLR